MPKQIIAPKNVHEASGYAHAIRAGNTIYVAGQVGYDKEGNLVGPDGASQTEQALTNMKGVLEAAGATMQDIVMLRIYTMDVEGFDKTRKFRKELFGGYHPPATLIVVKGLYGPGTVVEIEAIAVVD